MASFNPNQYMLDRTYGRLPQQQYGAPASNSMLQQLYETRGMLGSASTPSTVFPIQPNPMNRQGTGTRATPPVTQPYGPYAGVSSSSANMPYSSGAGGYGVTAPTPLPPTGGGESYGPVDPQRQAMEAQFRQLFPMGNPSGMAPQDLLAYVMSATNQGTAGSPATNPFFGTSQGRVQANMPGLGQMPNISSGWGSAQQPQQYMNRPTSPYMMGGIGGYNPYMGGMGMQQNPYATYYQQILSRLLRGY